MLFERFAKTAACLSAAGAVIVGVLIAAPWSGGYFYESPLGYAVLALFLAWAVSPNIFIFRSARSPGPARWRIAVSVSVITLVCVGGLSVMVAGGLLSTDPQRGLVLFIIPAYQWFLLGIHTAVDSVMTEWR